MELHDLAERIFFNLPYDPTSQQVELIAALARFCTVKRRDDPVFLLNGYAGTGKTSLIGALVRALHEEEVPVVLMAPTGRAAKVFSAFSGHQASTIHRRIYRGEPGQMLSFGNEVAANPLSDAVFIVDEASMIGDERAGGSSLLDDLAQYVFSGTDCRLILLGDTAQLPPVGCAVSPAMDVDRLHQLGLHVTKAVMTETVRQRGHTGLLLNATRLRKAMRINPLPAPSIVTRGFDDISVATAADLPDEINSSYSSVGIDDTLIVTRSNRCASLFNQAIRATILEHEEELTVGERLMVAKNNYLWSAKVRGLDFIANGDVATISHIYGTEEKYGFRFADVRLSLPDRDVDVECKLLLDTLVSDSASLPQERFADLYRAVLTDPDVFPESVPMSARMKMARRDPYLNALQVKYAYAVTCHKAQGGQWKHVYIDAGGIAPEATLEPEFYRWLYTAVTRATGHITLIDPSFAIID